MRHFWKFKPSVNSMTFSQYERALREAERLKQSWAEINANRDPLPMRYPKTSKTREQLTDELLELEERAMPFAVNQRFGSSFANESECRELARVQVEESIYRLVWFEVFLAAPLANDGEDPFLYGDDPQRYTFDELVLLAMEYRLESVKAMVESDYQSYVDDIGDRLESMRILLEELDDEGQRDPYVDRCIAAMPPLGDYYPDPNNRPDL